MSGKIRKRVDLFVVERGLAPSRQRAQALIMAGKVRVNGLAVDKPGTLIDPYSDVQIEADHPFVSRGGLKLQEALRVLKMDLADRVCLDVGASTGGFTDCLLQKGARLVFAVDVGYGQLAWALRQDPRVVVMERTNIRNMAADALPCPVDLVTIDVSFISLKIVVPAVLKYLKDTGSILALIKPQFEVGKGKVGKGGVVRDPAQHQEVIDRLFDFFRDSGLRPGPVIPSPVPGPKGNREFMIYLRQGQPSLRPESPSP
jgi:23S rRNA (cytidine1920-2'-O)/16S rRNA (cytidine1409-2'-O)-methyltransferase